MSDTIPQNEEEVDALLSTIEEPVSPESTDPGAKQEPSSTITDEFTFKVNGKEIKANRDNVLRWAQQGYEAPNKIGELNKKIESWTQKEQEWKAQQEQIKAYKEKYEQVDEYVKQNPQWWNTVQEQFKSTQQQGQINDPRLDSLMKEVDSLKQVANTYQERVQQQQAQQEDAKYIESFNAIQKQYPKIDFVTPDETGKNLEYKVLEFAHKEGIKEFTTAFKAFHHDELVKLAQEEAKSKIVTDRQSKTKLGILGISSTPTPRVTDSVKGKSYNDIQAEILQEYGLK